MQSKLIIGLLTYFILPLYLSGQQVISYSKQDFTDFVEIYFAQKEIKSKIEESEIIEIMDKYNVSNERYALMLKKAVENDSLQLEKNELMMMAEIDSRNKLIEERKLILIKEKCEDYQITWETYKEILSKYRQYPKFHQELIPYFNAYFKKMKE